MNNLISIVNQLTNFLAIVIDAFLHMQQVIQSWDCVWQFLYIIFLELALFSEAMNLILFLSLEEQ